MFAGGAKPVVAQSPSTPRGASSGPPRGPSPAAGQAVRGNACLAPTLPPPELVPGYDWRLAAYNLALLMLSPALAAYLLWRAATGTARAFPARVGDTRSVSCAGDSPRGPLWRERMGWIGTRRPRGDAPTSDDGPRIWIHAVSVGEVAAAGCLIEALRRHLPGAQVLVSTTTPAGRAMAAKVCRDADAIFYFPLDILPAVERALQRARPDLVLLVQSELWPNFISAARRRGIPTMVVNGRVSDRTMRRLRVFGPLFRWVVRRVDRFCMQSGMDARRIVELGADPLRVADTGNVKFDQAGARVPQEERTRLARELGVAGAQTVIIAASTHPGEEKIALDAFHTVRQVDPAARLIIAPRHVGRAGEVEQAVAQAGLRARWRSRGAQTSPRAQGLSPRGLSQAEGTVLVFLRKAGTVPGGAGEPAEGPNTVVILDTIGELGRVYAIATAAFVGGSFVASVGGHNILEPAAQGVPSVFGPHMETQRDIGGVITEAQLGFQVHRPQDVGRALAWLLEDRKRLALIGGRCDEVLARHRGAADRCAAAAAEIIGYRAPGMQVWDVAQPPTAVNGRRVAQSLPRASRRVFNLRISQDAILCHR